jgi:hypothetical protein
MPEENTGVKIGSGICVDKFAENFFKLVDGTLNQNFEVFIDLKILKKILEKS